MSCLLDWKEPPKEVAWGILGCVAPGKRFAFSSLLSCYKITMVLQNCPLISKEETTAIALYFLSLPSLGEIKHFSGAINELYFAL